MKKFIIKIIVTGILFGVINLIYLSLLYFMDMSFIKRFESLKFDNPDYEILVLGNSLACDGFDTELLGLTGSKAYNLAIPGSSIKTNYIQLQEYLSNYNKKPECIILGLGTYTMSNYVDETIHPIVEFTMEGHIYTYNDLPLLKFKWLAIEFIKKIVSSDHRNATLSYGQMRFQTSRGDHTNYTNSKFDMDEYQSSKYIELLAKLCKENDIKLYVIEMPGFKETQNNSDIGPYYLTFEKEDSVPLYNFNNIEFGKNFSSALDWVGNSHLNEKGAVKFTRLLIDSLLYEKLIKQQCK